MNPPDRAALARELTAVERLTPAGRELLRATHRAEPFIIGWTGAPGAGKSSLLSAVLAERLARFPKRLFAVLAIDPSSSYSGGAVLGDRIRMEAHALEERILIRSLASRGMAGGLAPSAIRLARFLAARGFDEIHIETVGAGQNDVEIRELCETIVVVTAPHAGDAVQGLKAGILEIADILVVNKADLDGAASAAAALEVALGEDATGWRRRLLQVSARRGDGLAGIAESLTAHSAHLEAIAGGEEIRRRRRRAEFEELLRLVTLERLRGRADHAELLEAVERGDLDPLSAAERALVSPSAAIA